MLFYIVAYLLLYLEENYGLTSEKKVQSAIKIVANENRYHPVRDYLNSLQWDGTERIRYALHHFLGDVYKRQGYRRAVCGRTHPDNLHQPYSQQD